MTVLDDDDDDDFFHNDHCDDDDDDEKGKAYTKGGKLSVTVLAGCQMQP